MNPMLAQLARAAENDLRYVGIFSPDFGSREDLPNVSLPEVMTAEAVNVLMRYGRIERAKMRLPTLTESPFTIGTVTATLGTKTLTASGGAGTWSGGADHKPYWVGRTITITDGGVDTDYTIDSVSDAGDTLELTVAYAGAGGAGLAYSIGTNGGGRAVATPDGNAVLRYHRLVQVAGGSEIEYLLALTAEHAYLWSTVWTAWILKFTCGEACTQWDTCDINEHLVATNGLDKVQTWGSTVTAAFAPLTGDANGIDLGAGVYLTKARCCITYENRVILGYVTVDGITYSDRWECCRDGDETDWDQTGDGDPASFRLRDGRGGIVGFGTWRGWLMIAKERSWHRYWLVESDDIFNGEPFLEDVGCLARHSIINDREGRMYWLANDYTIREASQGVVSQAKDVTLRDINPSLQASVQAAQINEYGQIWWAIPYGGASTGNNKVLAFDPNEGRWSEMDMAVSAFGNWTQQTVYDWSNLPFDNWADWGWEDWAGPENVIGFWWDIAGDYSGYTYRLHAAEKDAGDDYAGYVVLSTDAIMSVMQKRYHVGLRSYKRLLEMQLAFYSEGESDTAEIYVKRDNETVWQTVGSVSLNSDQALATVEVGCDVCDMRGRHFLIKIAGSNPWRFVGAILGFTVDGKD